MNYQCDPDVDPEKNLTADAVRLFQRFRQDTDRNTVSDLLEREIARHIKLCELAILYYADCRHYWAELPPHPIPDVMTCSFRHLREQGFKVEWDKSSGARGRTRWTASWLHASANAELLADEWDRRVQLEDEERLRHPPKPLSRVEGGKVDPGQAIWATVVDGSFVVEVQPIAERSFLCVFAPEGKCLTCEETPVSFDALFGPDIGDVANWEKRALEIVDSLKK